MISSAPVAVVLSVVLVLTALYAAVRLVRSHGIGDRIGYALHVLMSVAMFCMVWPWGIDLLLVPQMVVFAAAAVWFAILALPSEWVARRRVEGHHHGRRTMLYHSGMMAAMVLMAAAMMGMSMGSSTSSTMDMGSMPNMDMSGGGGMVSPLWVGVVSLVLAIAFGIAALYFLGSSLRAVTSSEGAGGGLRAEALESGWNLLMAAGMAVLFVPMVSF